jgi:hypothetical protein
LWSWTDNQLVHSAAAFARIVRTSSTGRLLRRPAGADRDQRKRSVSQPPTPFRWDFGGEIALVGYEWQPTGPRSFSITYAWLGERPATNDYAISVHLDGPGVRFQDDYVLGAGSQWQSGKPIEITREVTVPEGAPPGWYIIRVGAWQPSTGRKLRLSGGWFPKTSIDLVDLKVTSGDVRYLSRSQLPFLRHE